MNNAQQLSPAGEAILQELVQYHRQRLHHFQDAAAQRQAERDRVAPWSLARAIDRMSVGQLDGAEREHLEEAARVAGVPFDPLRPFIPFNAVRDLNVASSTAGGFLTAGTAAADPIDILRPWSVTARAGILIEMGLAGDIVIPKTSAKSTPTWLTNETAQVTPSQPTLAAAAVTPKSVGIVTAFSRQLSKQANAEAFVRRELMRTVGTAVDQAVINGSGTAGQPLGLLNTPGILTESGTSLNAGTRTMKRKVAEANVDDARIAFLSTPAVRELLETRELVTGSGRFVWDGDRVADRPAMVSTDVPAATMICGDFANAYLGIWGLGFVVEINPYDPSGFKAGTIHARIIASCDVALLQPGAFDVATSIT